MRKLNKTLAILAGTVVLAGPVLAEYPEREITFIVPYNPGGSTDPIARAFAAELSKNLGVSVIVENRPGGSATIGTGDVLNADPDGYTIGLGSNSSLAFQPIVMDHLNWTTPEDYDVVAKLVDVPAILYVGRDSPYQTLEDFMADVDARPGEIRASVSGLRTAPDMVVQYFNSLTGKELRTVPFSGGGGEALTAVLSGQVESSVGYGPSIRAYVDSGDVRPIGVFAKEPTEDFPTATPIATEEHDASLPASYYVIAPNDIPAEVRASLIEASNAAIASDEFRNFARTNSYEVDILNTEEAEAELDRYKTVFEEILAYIDANEG